MKEYHGWSLDKANLIEGPISCSMLKRFDENPYAWNKAGEFKQTPAMKLGSLYDAALTDPDELRGLCEYPERTEAFELLPFPNLMTKAAKAWKAEREAEGARVLTASQKGKEDKEWNESFKDAQERKLDAKRAASEVHAHPIAGKILDGAEFQVGVIGEIGGIPAKCLLDILPAEGSEYGETLWDYKTTGTGISDEAIRKTIGNFKLHWQASFYRTMFEKAQELIHPGKENVKFRRLITSFGFIFQCVHTHEVRVITLSEDGLVLGNRGVRNALVTFRKAAENGIKSRYLETTDDLDLMPYHAMNEDEELNKREGSQS